MRVGLVQIAAGLDRSANLQALAERLRAFEEPKPDLVICPEASMHDFGPPDAPLAPHAESLDGPFVTGVAELAVAHGVTVLAGMFEARGAPGSDDRPYNTLVALGPDGELRAAYRKLHLYDAFGYAESDRMAAGDNAPVTLDVGGVRLGLLTCYDLRFPELSRALAARGADVLAVPAAWVRGPLKEDHWSTLLRARAIENTCYVAAAAQCGPRYCGRSVLLDPLGVTVCSLGEQAGECVGDVRADRLADVRERNPTLRHRRFHVAMTHSDTTSDTTDEATGASEATGTGVAGT